MSLTSSLPDIEILQFLDFEPAIDCVVSRCSSDADWVIHWSCGCIREFCTAHKNEMVDVSARGLVHCKRWHGFDKIYPLAVVPIDK